MKIEEAFAWIADVFELDLEDISPEMERDDIEAWDSLGMLSLMARLDEDFEIMLEEDDLDTLQGVQSIIDLLQRNNKIVEQV